MTLWRRALKCFLPVCLCLSSMLLFLSFFRTCACFGRDPLASPLPLSPPEQTAPCRMDFLYTMPHCVLTPFLDTSGDLRTKKKRERQTTGNVKEIFQITSSPCWEDSAVRSHTFVTCIQSSFCSGDHCKHLCFVVFFPPVGARHPCSTADSSLCRLLLLGSAPQTVPWCTRWGTTTAKRNQDCVHCS